MEQVIVVKTNPLKEFMMGNLEEAEEELLRTLQLTQADYSFTRRPVLFRVCRCGLFFNLAYVGFCFRDSTKWECTFQGLQTGISLYEGLNFNLFF